MLPRPRVGIPQGMFYFHYLPLWQVFFEELGCEVVISPQTNKEIVDRGVRHCVDEACFPVKIFTGHVLELLDKVDYLFLPRLVSVEKKTYMCPKVLGLPDMIKCAVKNLPTLISPDINLHDSGNKLYPRFLEVGRLFEKSPHKILQAFKKGEYWLEAYWSRLQQGYLCEEALDYVNWVRSSRQGETELQQKSLNTALPLRIAVISQPYNLYDTYASMNLLALLHQRGVEVLTPENLAQDVINKRAAQLPKKLFWSTGKRLIGSAFEYLEREDVDGVIHLASFGCGPDAFTGDIIERAFRRQGVGRFLNLTVDEHTGEAGLVTRIEAFLDMLQRRVACAKESSL